MPGCVVAAARMAILDNLELGCGSFVFGSGRIEEWMYPSEVAERVTLSSCAGDGRINDG